MVSIRESMTELEKVYELQSTLLDCYKAAIRSMAQYAVEIDDQITPAHQQHLTAVAADLAAAPDAERVASSRSMLRNELRDYRDRASSFLNGLRTELVMRADALQAIVDAMASDENDHEEQIQNAVARLRKAAELPAAAAVSAALLEGAAQIEASVKKIKHRTALPWVSSWWRSRRSTSASTRWRRQDGRMCLPDC